MLRTPTLSAHLPRLTDLLLLLLPASLGAAASVPGAYASRVSPASFVDQNVTAVPVNVLTHISVGDAAQYDPEVVALGSNVVVAFETSATRINYSVSTDGGATFADMGEPPAPAGHLWRNDPQLEVNEKTGELWLIGQVTRPSPTRVRLASVKGSFSGTTLVWGTPTFVSPEITSPFIYIGLTLDAAADSSSGNVYVAWNNFYTTAATELYRSADGGTTWEGPLPGLPASVAATTIGKLVTGPEGAFYILGSSFPGATAGRAAHKGGVSLDPGAPLPTWSEITISPDVVLNYLSPLDGSGTSALVKAACDRTSGMHRGRIYAAWPEPYAFDTQPLPSLVDPDLARLEVEPNDATVDATPLTVGTVLRGDISILDDVDFYRLTLAAGDHVIFAPDSMPAFPAASFIFRIDLLAPDGTQRYGLDQNQFNGTNVRPLTFVAPQAGDYYLRCERPFGASLGSYRIRIAAGTGGALLRDQRDIALTYSDDHGATWSAPVRLNDEGSGYDDVMPTLAVGGDGCPYAIWSDRRDDFYGTRMHIYASRSPDGGDTWPPAARISSAISDWTAVTIPPTPARNALVADGQTLRAAWGDARAPQVDVYAASWSTGFDVSGCSGAGEVAPGDDAVVGLTIENQNTVFDHDFTVTVTDERGWPLPQTTATVGAGASDSPSLNVPVPDSAAMGINTLTLHVTNAKGTLERTCAVALDVRGVTGVGSDRATFALHPSHPNPARGRTSISFQLAAQSPARLVIYGTRGELVRTLVDEVRSAGSHTVAWDGLGAHGQRVAPGIYYYRLEAAGRMAMRRLVLLR